MRSVSRPSSFLLLLEVNFDTVNIPPASSSDRMGIIWLKAGIWNLRGVRRGFERGRCPQYLGEGDAKHILLKC
jgi:hypothetical protein